jgi:hypothetical protein
MQNPSGPAAMVGRPSITILRPLRRVRPGVEMSRVSVCRNGRKKFGEALWRKWREGNLAKKNHEKMAGRN